MVFLVSTMLVIFVGAACQGEPQHEPAQPERELPAMVTPGEEFEVTVTFTSPHDAFHAIGLTDVAPLGWNVTVNMTWATPPPMTTHITAPEEAVYIWAGPFDNGVEFNAVYKVQVPADAERETYIFAGFLEYFIEPHPESSYKEEISGDVQVTVG